MRKKASTILRKIAKKENLNYKGLKRYFNTLSPDRKTGLLNEGRKLEKQNKMSYNKTERKTENNG